MEAERARKYLEWLWLEECRQDRGNSSSSRCMQALAVLRGEKTVFHSTWAKISILDIFSAPGQPTQPLIQYPPSMGEVLQQQQSGTQMVSLSFHSKLQFQSDHDRFVPDLQLCSVKWEQPKEWPNSKSRHASTHTALHTYLLHTSLHITTCCSKSPSFHSQFK